MKSNSDPNEISSMCKDISNDFDCSTIFSALLRSSAQFPIPSIMIALDSLSYESNSNYIYNIISVSHSSSSSFKSYAFLMNLLSDAIKQNRFAFTLL